MVFYRKYRFQTLEEMVGQALVKQTLKGALAGGKLAHAYLFYGPRGTGKTSTARILAKIVNCEMAAGSLPCNKCPTCIAITEGNHLDVIEMDAASNRGIEDIRNLRENIKLSPTSAKKKVYIIDEVHMLSGDAFNALLKTLEEPPAHVLFILATTEIQKVPPTILSRVAKLNFRPATTSEMVEVLKRVAKEEKINIDNKALFTLAKLAQGSFRDGIKLLDQLSSAERIDQKVIEEGLGTGMGENVVAILQNIARGDGTVALKKVLEEISSGTSSKELTLSILDSLRQLLLIKNGLGEELVKEEIGEEKYADFVDLAGRFQDIDLTRITKHFQESLEQARFASIPSLPLELAIIESCGRSDEQSRSDEVRKSEDQIQSDKIRESEIPNSDSLTSSDAPSSSDSSGIADIQKISDRWSYILETVRQYNYSLEALLRSAKIIDCEKNTVIIEVPYSFHQRILEAPKSRDILESILADILGRAIKITTVLGKRPVKTDELANVEVAADDEIVRLAAEIFNSETVN